MTLKQLLRWFRFCTPGQMGSPLHPCLPSSNRASHCGSNTSLSVTFPILQNYFNPLSLSSSLILPHHPNSSLILTASYFRELRATGGNSLQLPPTSFTNLKQEEVASWHWSPAPISYLHILDPTTSFCLLRRSELVHFSCLSFHLCFHLDLFTDFLLLSCLVFTHLSFPFTNKTATTHAWAPPLPLLP